MPKNSSNKTAARPQWWKSVNRPAGTVKISDLNSYGYIEKPPSTSAIDQYFSNTEQLIRLGNKQTLDANKEIANLMFVGIISQTENYFREIFSTILEICPVSQVKASARDIKLGSVIWHRTGKIERGAFEGFSFASSDNLIDTVKRYFDITLDPKSDCHALLAEFDNLCELRHAIVHSGGVMSGKNSLKLHFKKTPHNLQVAMNFTRFQEAASICNALVCSLNSELFRHFSTRWRDEWPKRSPNWTSSVSTKSFSKLWKIFHSETDQGRGAIAVPLAKQRCRREIEAP